VDRNPAALPSPNLDSVIFMTLILLHGSSGTIN
jgi:hypothetical protein